MLQQNVNNDNNNNNIQISNRNHLPTYRIR